ncbi:type a von willebrand factor domain-containing protein [Stylonychia lemnae]|uniref:Type a von willebrand factor domain-containing protein n=1 Tax=Stylonychia lemnae TaxID=5949 RepID=A0A078A989_STYLE|nr:type a von willebrand factor domain-containing protein [Stylonychia lemnae]|eukprot:CDW77368.1 type a von willebrand factor domain-containing protein [Stylonychia lemnae]
MIWFLKSNQIIKSKSIINISKLFNHKTYNLGKFSTNCLKPRRFSLFQLKSSIGLKKMQMPSKIAQIPSLKVEKRSYKHEVDTNVFSISLGCLKNGAELASGNPIYCENCQGIFNKFSIIAQENSLQVWNCEFCQHKNLVDMAFEQVPKSDTIDYILESPFKEEEEKEVTPNLQSQNDISIVYCLDISDSMNKIAHQQLVPKDQNIRLLSKPWSRLDSVQSVIAAEIQEMAKEHPNRKVGAVTFGDKISIIGDGQRNTEEIAYKQLGDYEFIVNKSIACAKKQFSNPISQCWSHLIHKIVKANTERNTALGPAILSSISIAGEGSSGSQVIVCTDGIANIGLGALNKPQNKLESAQFYQKLGELAQEKGVTVNIVTLIGQDCKIHDITPVVELSGGQIERVDPVELRDNFMKRFNRKVLATNVCLKVKLHKALQFRNEVDQNLSCNKTILTKQFGNINEDTDVTFEYKLKSVKDLIEMQDFDLTQLSQLPFQVQIYFTALNGSKCMRVISSQTQISSDKEFLEKNANIEILGLNAIQQSSKLARQGYYETAKVAAKAWYNKLERIAQDNNNMAQIEQFNNFKKKFEVVYGVFKQENAQYKSDRVSQILFSNSRINRAQFQNKI